MIGLTLLLAFSAAPAQLSAADASDAPLESRPYRVLVSLSFAADAGLPPAFRHRTIEETSRIVDRSLGRMWIAEIVENDWLLPASAAGLDRLTAADLRSRFAAEAAEDAKDYDKVFLVTVDVSGAGYELSGREWDAGTRSLGAIASVDTFERRDVARSIAGLLQQLFRPVLGVERASEDEAVLRVRAGRFPAPDPQAAQIRPGDLIQPFFRYLDQQQVVRRVQSLPWTYLVADSVDEGRVKCSLITGLRSPLAGSRRRLVEVTVLRVRPRFPSTRLKFVPRGNRSKRLIGYTLSAVAKLHANDEPAAKPLDLVTNRQGFVDVSVDAGDPLVWLYVRSGESLLARVPFAPGIHETETIELPDDSIRLAAEGETDLLVNRLVDTVARRAVLITRARIMAREGDWKGVDRQLAQLDGLPGIEDYERQLNLIRVPAVEAARAAKDPAAEANVRRICSRVMDLIHRYLSEESVRTLKTDIRELKQLDEKDRKAAGSP